MKSIIASAILLAGTLTITGQSLNIERFISKYSDIPGHILIEANKRDLKKIARVEDIEKVMANLGKDDKV